MTAGRAGTTARVALRGDDGDVGEAAEAAGVTVVDDDDVDVDVAVAVGSEALSALADDPPDVPVLPVDAELGRYSLPPARVGAAVEALVAGDVGTFDQPTLRVAVEGTPVGHALADVTLMTADPARISEYALDAEGAPVDSFRADGVVAATPLGSEGYAHAAGGAVLGPGTGVGVVPVSPFAISSDVWVFRPPLSLSVERDEGDVSLALDGCGYGTVDPHAAVDVTEGTPVQVVFVPGLDG